MAEFSISAKDMINFAIKTENEGMAFYKLLAERADESLPGMFYKRREDKIVWSEERGFYKDLEEKLIGGDPAQSFFYNSMPQKVTKSDYISFYQHVEKKLADDVKSVLIAMSDDEKRHAESFRLMLAQMDGAADEVFAPGAAEYFQKYSANLAFDDKNSNAPKTILEALAAAVEMERETVDFYVGMLGFANAETKPILEKIINEEKNHKAKLESQKDKYLLLTKE